MKDMNNTITDAILQSMDEELMNKYESLLVHIPEGQDNAISMNELSRVLDMDQRAVRLIIQHARTDGIIIAGTHAGIFIPLTIDECRAYVHRTEERILTSVQTVQPAKHLIELFLEDPEDDQ